MRWSRYSSSRRTPPEIQIDWIVEERFAEVLKNNPDIDNILTVNLKSLKTNKAGIFSAAQKNSQLCQ